MTNCCPSGNSSVTSSSIETALTLDVCPSNAALNRLVSVTVCEQTPLDPLTFAAQAAFFLETVSDAMKNTNKKQQGESIALLSLDALIFNLYKAVRANEEFRPANSSLYGWLSNSHMSLSG